jgi:heme-degrading monooxygenase HmoA
MWRGWTAPNNADAYERYLTSELLPQLERSLRDRGYRGYHLLRTTRDAETEFVTMLWFENLEAVKSFAGEDFETPVISSRAKSLLARYAARCEHYHLSGSNLFRTS